MSKQFEGQVALVTGGSTGIGAALAKQLAEGGAKVLITGRHEDTLKASAQQHTSISYVVADIAKPADAARSIAEAKSRFGRLDVLVNDAAYNKSIPFTDLDNLTLEVWDKIIAVNLTGPMRLIKAVAPIMKAHGRAASSISRR